MLEAVRHAADTGWDGLHGEHYRLTRAVCEPKPVQDPLPLLIGGLGERRMLRIVAEYADVWNAWASPELVAQKSAVLDRHCADVGRDPRAVKRTAQALVVVDGPLPQGLPVPVFGSSRRALAAVTEGQEISAPRPTSTAVWAITASTNAAGGRYPCSLT